MNPVNNQMEPKPVSKKVQEPDAWYKTPTARSFGIGVGAALVISGIALTILTGTTTNNWDWGQAVSNLADKVGILATTGILVTFASATTLIAYAVLNKKRENEEASAPKQQVEAPAAEAQRQQVEAVAKEVARINAHEKRQVRTTAANEEQNAFPNAVKNLESCIDPLKYSKEYASTIIELKKQVEELMEQIDNELKVNFNCSSLQTVTKRNFREKPFEPLCMVAFKYRLLKEEKDSNLTEKQKAKLLEIGRLVIDYNTILDIGKMPLREAYQKEREDNRIKALASEKKPASEQERAAQ